MGKHWQENKNKNKHNISAICGRMPKEVNAVKPNPDFIIHLQMLQPVQSRPSADQRQ